MLGDAIRSKNLKMVKELLVREPAIIDEPIDNKWPPFLAAEIGDLALIRYIVEYSRASMNVTDSDNRDILHYGVMSGDLSVVRYLVEKVGMDPLRGDRWMMTPFDLAVENEYNDIREYFEEYCGASYSDFYRNPILTGMHPDPSIICVGEDFYMVNSSFVFFPCIPISHSKDLVHWKTIGYAITKSEWAGLDELEGGRGYWAPDISYFEGRFYITATYRMNDTGTIYRKQMVTSSKYPQGPYDEPVFLDEDGIDPSIFTDADNRRYMILNRGARAFEISADGTKQLSEAKLLYYGHQKRAPEGSHVLYKDGWYYLFQAEGGTGDGHRISVSRASELFGTYKPCPFNPILRQSDEKALIQCCGHGKPVQTPAGEWYIVYLCSRKWDGKYGFLGRETMLNKMTWTAEGWPIINEGKGPGVLQKKPLISSGEQKNCASEESFYAGAIVEDLNYECMFNGFSTEEDWWTVRSIEQDAIAKIQQVIKIKGSSVDLNSRHANNLLLRRQTCFRYYFGGTIKVPSLEFGQYLGITCYYDENTYLVYGIRKEVAGTVLFLSEHILDETVTVKTQYINLADTKEMISLLVETRGLERKFYYIQDDKKEEFAVLSNVYYLCDEGVRRGKRFTGAMAGFFVYQGEGNEVIGEFSKVRFGDIEFKDI